MTKQETYQYLAHHGVLYEVTEHAAVFNMEELRSIELPHPDCVAKNLFVRDDKKRNYYLISLRGDKRVDLKEFRKAHGLRNLSFASAPELASVLGLVPGMVTPLGLLNDEEKKVTLYLDQAFLGGLIGAHPNDNTATVWIKTEDLVRLIQEHGNTVNFTAVANGC